ncbi:unnamed protein product [Caenorhabditis brenneri]
MGNSSSYLDKYPSPYGVFRNSFVFSDIRSFLTGQQRLKKSKFITKGSISCRLVLVNNQIREGLGFRMECKVKGANDKSWRIRAQVIFLLINQLDESRSRRFGVRYYGQTSVAFHHGMQSTGFALVLPNTAILDESQGFLKDDKLELVLDVRVRTIERFNSRVVFNFYEPFKESAETSHSFSSLKDIHTIHYNKTLPSVHSMIFEESFAQNKCDQWNVFDIPQLLLFAEACKVHNVKRKCEDFIVQTHYPIIPEEFFKLAYQHNLRRVIHAYLRTVPSIDKSILKSLNVQGMSGETMKAIMNRMLYHEL